MSEEISASRYWVLRGSFAPGLDVAWSTVPVLHQAGPIDARIAGFPGNDDSHGSVGSFSIGLPGALGAPPERTTVQVELSNADGALDPWIVGAERTAIEYTKPNFLTFEGRLYRGTVALDGTCTEEPFTPTLAASGPVTVDRAQGTVSLSLMHIDRPILGPVRKLYTLREAAAPTLDSLVSGFGALNGRFGNDGDALWAECGTTDSDARDVVVPWLYGPVTTPLIRITKEGVYPAAYIAGMAWEKVPGKFSVDPYAEIAAKIRSEYSARPRTLKEPLPFAACVELDVEGGGTRRAWLALAIQAEMPEEHSKAEQYWWSSEFPNGLPDDGIGEAPSSPAAVLREIVTDHAEAGAACLHTESWAAVEERQRIPMRSACAGRIESETTIAELVQCIAPLGGMGLWVGPDDLLHVTTGGWGREDAEEAAGELPTLIEPDAYPGDEDGTPVWTEAVPSDPDDRGAVLTKVSPNWTAEQRELFPIPVALGIAPRRVPLAIDAEWSPEAAWINPRAPGPVVRAMASRGAYPTRRVHVESHPSLALLGPGTKLRASHPWGVTAEPPYWQRLVRFERAEVQPGEHAASLTLEDLGPSEQIRLGLLDTIVAWSAYRPKLATEKLVIYPDGKATATVPAFAGLSAGCTIWAHGASNPANRRSYRIKKIIDDTSAEVSSPPDAIETITATAAPSLIDESWHIMHTHESKGAAFRPDYIRGSRLPDGVLVGGGSGYQFGG